jgi:uncharacterized protein (DUF2336 family)
MRSRLTHIELQQFLEDPNEGNRAKMASKIVTQSKDVSLSDNERLIAQEILRVMAKDAAVMVREAMAIAAQGLDDLPKDIALELARDVEAVALPLLEASNVFSDEDLVSLVRGGSPEKQVAIATRHNVGASVSEALVDTGDTLVVAELVRNQSANIPEVLMHRVVDEFGDDEGINGPMALRNDVPATIAERLVVLVSDEIRSRMIKSGKIEEGAANQLLQESRERATIDLAQHLGQGKEIGRLVRQLKDNGRLTSSVIVRAVCSGEMRFFEEALACLTGVEFEKAWVLTHDEGNLGFKALFKKAGLPEDLYRVCRIALDVFHELEPDLVCDDDAEFAKKMTQRVLTQYEDLEGEDLDFLLNRLAVRDAANESSAPRLDAAEAIAANG